MVTAASSAMRKVVDHVRPVLKERGFRKRAHTFNRTVEPGLIQVVKYQMGAYDPPGLVEIPGVRENLYGLFSVHLGIFIEEAWRLGVGSFGPDGPPGVKDWANDYDCQMRRLISNLAGESMNYMWPLDDPGVGPAMVELLHSDAFVWFDGFGSRAAILAELESAPIESYEVSGETGGGPDRLLATRMRLGAGDRQRAQQHFDDWVAYCLSRVESEPHLRGHLEYLADFASRVGLQMSPADRAS
jgi:hypothetical protein